MRRWRGAASTSRDGNAPYITVLTVRLAVCIYNALTGRSCIADLYYGRKFTDVVVNFGFTPSGLHALDPLFVIASRDRVKWVTSLDMDTGKGMVRVNFGASLTIQPYGTQMNQTFYNLYTNNNGCKEDDCGCQLL